MRQYHLFLILRLDRSTGKVRSTSGIRMPQVAWHSSYLTLPKLTVAAHDIREFKRIATTRTDYEQRRSQDFSEGEAIVTTQLYGGQGHAPPENFWNLGLWNGISCILRVLLSIYSDFPRGGGGIAACPPLNTLLTTTIYTVKKTITSQFLAIFPIFPIFPIVPTFPIFPTEEFYWHNCLHREFGWDILNSFLDTNYSPSSKNIQGMFEGDIKTSGVGIVANAGSLNPWPNAVIPYRFDCSIGKWKITDSLTNKLFSFLFVYCFFAGK